MIHSQLFIEKLQHPQSLEVSDLDWLEELVDEHPYFQSARALYLKALHNQRSHLYNAELKKTAAYTQDRDVLFDFIVSNEFISYQPISVENIKVVEEDYINVKKPEPTLEENIEKSILSSLAYIDNPDKKNPIFQTKEPKSSSIKENEDSEKIISQLEDKLEVGTPLPFENNEKHSFSEWLKLTQAQPIIREIDEKEEPATNLPATNIDERQKKQAIIDRFIEANPKITPVKQSDAPPVIIDTNEENQPYLMTETLAKIYLEQKKYQKAIQAYEILILKYPEKSSLFADRIHDIKMLQQYNS